MLFFSVLNFNYFLVFFCFKLFSRYFKMREVDLILLIQDSLPQNKALTFKKI